MALSRAMRRCYLEAGSACPDAEVSDVFAAVADRVEKACRDATAVRDAGFGPRFTPATLTARLQNACRAEVASLAARSFGGPHARALSAADPTGRTCLATAHEAAAMLIADAARSRDECLADQADGRECDPGAADAAIVARAGESRDTIDAACPDLSALVAVDTGTFVDRALAQAECLTAAAHGDSTPFHLSCGPRDAVEDVPRGKYVQIVLDEQTWGTRCGDGSPFAFWVRLAPPGSPVENVVVGMQGGGVCIFEDDCARRPSGLFEALEDDPPTTGTMSNDPAASPLAAYTKLYLPYCTQDVFIGGGATSNFDRVTVHRFGAINVRAALRWLRDAIWRELDRSSAEGYSPQRMRVYFGGFSAGGFGTLYNYHYVLDDLQWAHTIAYPDASLALDSGDGLSVAALGAIVLSGDPPVGWDAGNYLPPYCFETDCGLGPKILERSSPRLLAVHEQQFLILSNQNDGTQVSTTFFNSAPDWINAMRQSYCDTRDLPGVHYYLPPIPESIHVISPRPELYAGLRVDGQEMRDWLAQGMSDPGGLRSRVEEGNLVELIDGVEPFPCEVAP